MALIRLILLGFFMFAGTLSQAETSRIKLAPVNLDGYVGNDLKISYELPCGSEYFGLVTAPDRKGGLQVAIAAKVSDIHCTSLPDRQTQLINFVATRGFKVIRPMETRSFHTGRLVHVPLRELRIVKGKSKKRTRLQTLSETRCGTHVGAVIRRTSTSRVEVAFLEHMTLGQKTGECPKEQKVRYVDSLKLEKGTKIGAMQGPRVDTKRAFDLKIAAIDARSLKFAEDGSLSFRYRRQCSQAPVGHIVSTRKRKSKAVLMGMLVADYKEIKCAKASGSWEWLTYKTKDIRIPKGWKVNLMAASKPADRLAIKSPTEFAKTKKAKKAGLYVEYIGGCDLTLGAVYARSLRSMDSDVLAVGVLTRKATSKCKKRLSQISLYQPFISNKVAVTDMFPLRIKGMGSLAH